MKNFTILKESIYNEIIKCLRENRSRAKKLLRGYVAILKKYPVLKEAFYIHNNLNYGYFTNEDVKHGFIIENLNAIKRLNKEELHLGLKALDQFIRSNKIKYAANLNTLGEKISNLMLNINKINKSIENNQTIEQIIETILKREINHNPKKPVNQKLFKEIALKKYHEKYGNLSETEKQIVKSFYTGNKLEIQKQYNKLVSEIKQLVDAKIQTTEDKDIKIKLYEVKDRLLDIPKDITLEHFKKLLQLQEHLK